MWASEGTELSLLVPFDTLHLFIYSIVAACNMLIACGGNFRLPIECRIFSLIEKRERDRIICHIFSQLTCKIELDFSWVAPWEGKNWKYSNWLCWNLQVKKKAAEKKQRRRQHSSGHVRRTSFSWHRLFGKMFKWKHLRSKLLSDVAICNLNVYLFLPHFASRSHTTLWIFSSWSLSSSTATPSTVVEMCVGARLLLLFPRFSVYFKIAFE